MIDFTNPNHALKVATIPLKIILQYPLQEKITGVLVRCFSSSFSGFFKEIKSEKKVSKPNIICDSWRV